MQDNFCKRKKKKILSILTVRTMELFNLNFWKSFTMRREKERRQTLMVSLEELYTKLSEERQELVSQLEELDTKIAAARKRKKRHLVSYQREEQILLRKRLVMKQNVAHIVGINLERVKLMQCLEGFDNTSELFSSTLNDILNKTFEEISYCLVHETAVEEEDDLQSEIELKGNDAGRSRKRKKGQQTKKPKKPRLI